MEPTVVTQPSKIIYQHDTLSSHYLRLLKFQKLRQYFKSRHSNPKDYKIFIQKNFEDAIKVSNRNMKTRKIHAVTTEFIIGKKSIYKNHETFFTPSLHFFLSFITHHTTLHTSKQQCHKRCQKSTPQENHFNCNCILQQRIKPFIFKQKLIEY